MDPKTELSYAPPGHPSNKKVFVLILLFLVTALFAIASVFLVGSKVKPDVIQTTLPTPTTSSSQNTFLEPTILPGTTSVPGAKPPIQ